MKIVMVVGCPGSGKSWVCDQLKHQYHYVNHDARAGMRGPAYVHAIVEAAAVAQRTLLTEAPFSLSELVTPLRMQGFEIELVFIQEDPLVIAERYLKREGRPIPQGHLTRQNTFLHRAKAAGAFHGTSNEVLEHLKGKYYE